MLDTVLLVLLWCTVIVRLPSLRRGAAQWALWTLFLTLALAKTVVLGSVAQWIDQSAGKVDTATLLHHLLGIVSAVSVLYFISMVTDGDTGRPRIRAYYLGSAVLASAVMTVLFFVTDDRIHNSVDELLSAPIVSFSTVVYWLVLEFYLGVVVAMAARLLWGVSRQSVTGVLRVGFSIIGIGAFLNALYALYKFVYIVLHSAGVPLPAGVIATTSNLLLSVAVFLVVVGAAIPAVARSWQFLRLRWAIRALEPLWQTMQREFPAMILPQKPPTTSGILASSRLRLYQRLIEIRDGMLELRRYASPDVVPDAREYLVGREVEESQLAVLAEACWIELALRRLKAGAQVSGEPQTSAVGQGGASVEEEADWLISVSRARVRSRHPAEFAAWWERSGRAESPGEEIGSR